MRVYNRALSTTEIQADMNAAVIQDTTAPTTPTGLANPSRTTTSVSLSWNASTDNVGVAGYGLYKNGTSAGSSSTTTATLSNLSCGTTYSAGVDAYDQAGNRSAIATINAATLPCAGSPPTVGLTAPAANSTVSGTVTVSANASDDTGVLGVQFRLDGNVLGAEDTSAPYSVSWGTTTATNGSHTLTAVARDGSGNSTTSSPIAVTVSNQTAPNFVVDTLITGLAQPTQIVFTPDGRMLILQRAGKVLVVPAGGNQPSPTPFLQLSSVATSDERGALGIVLDPNFATNGFFYVMYTHSSLSNRVSRFTAVGNTASASSEVVLWQNDVQAAIYHQGGGLAFGPDGKLYISVGDNLTAASAQDLSSFNGKILRINPDGSVPSDNPFYDGPGPNDDAIWALGLRNPFRFTFDSATGRMLIGDVGEGSWEEVDIGTRGSNYGWPTCEGVCGVSGMTNPIYTYSHAGRDASITGGVVYHGNTFGPGYDGSYFFGDYPQNWIKRLTFDASGNLTGTQNFLPANGAVDGPYGDPVNICQGPDGSLYYVDIGALDVPNSGTIRRVRNLNGDLPPIAASAANPSTGAAPLTVAFSSAGSSDPEGRSLTYSWDFGDGTTSTAANPSHVYPAQGSYSVRLAVSDGANTAFSRPRSRSGSAVLRSRRSPRLPTGRSSRPGQVINFAGGATDPDDGTLSGASLSWTVVFNHETHQHPGPGPFTGSSGSFTMPISGHDFTGTTNYQIILTATDSSGLSTSTSVFIRPRKVNVTFNSAPQGLTILVDSLPHTTPYTFDSLIGFHHTIDAPSPQSLAGSNYAFTSWSDGGAQVHDIVVPSVDQAYTATFIKPSVGLVAAYGFNAGSGSVVTDVSGAGNNGTTANTTWSSAGKNLGALSFNGTSSLVTVPDSASLDLTSGMTLEAWVSPNTMGSLWRSVIFKERPGGMLYSLYANNGGSGRPTGQVYLGGEKNAAGASTLPLNTWTHLATTYDGSSLRLYVNGALVTTTVVTGALTPTTNALRIGGNSIWGEYFSGLIDDVRIYSRALSAAELQGDMTTPVNG